MTMITDLKPKGDPVVLGQCCVPIDRSQDTDIYLERIQEKAAHWGWDHHFCLMHARYEINGEFYCSRHGGMKALEILLSQQDK